MYVLSERKHHTKNCTFLFPYSLPLSPFIPVYQDSFLWNYSCLLMSLAKSSLCGHEPVCVKPMWVVSTCLSIYLCENVTLIFLNLYHLG